jgi:hypothetical protein
VLDELFYLLLPLLVQWHNLVIVIPLDDQVLQSELVIDRLLVDELLHQAVVVLEPPLELAVSVGFDQPSIVGQVLGKEFTSLQLFLSLSMKS